MSNSLKSLSDLSWRTYPVKVARKDRGTCELCGKPIRPRGRYSDGGNTRRAHAECVDYCVPPSA